MRTTAARTLLVAVLVAAGVATLPATPAGAVTYTGVTARMSVGPGASQATNGDAEAHPYMSDDGRFVAFSSPAPFVVADTNASLDVYIRDRLASSTELVSFADGGTTALGFAYVCSVSSDGRFVGYRNGGDTYLRDLHEDTTEQVNVNSAEEQDDSQTTQPVGDCPISDNGRYVAFTSRGTNLAPGPDAVTLDVFRRDRQAGVTVAISSTDGTTDANGGSLNPTMSGDGNIVGFETAANNLVPGDTKTFYDVVARNVTTGVNTRISLAGAATELDGDANSPSVSSDGRWWAFETEATNAVPSDGNGTTTDVIARDTVTKTNDLVSVSSNETQLNAVGRDPSISDDGRYVAFRSTGKLSIADTNAVADVYLRDRTVGNTTLVSRQTSSILAGNGASSYPQVGDNGRVVAFASLAGDLVRNDTNGKQDVFVRDFQVDHTPFDSFDELITQGYADMLDRAPTAAERAEAKAKLVNGEQSPDTVLMRLISSPEWSTSRAPVIRLYWAFFLRAPEQSGLDYWLDQYASGKSLNEIASFFAKSNEFKTTYGSLSNAAFVTKIYNNIFDRDPDAGGQAFWTNKLNTGAKTRGDVMVNFSESAEGKRYLAAPVNTVLIWLGMLREVPPKATFDPAVLILRGGEPSEYMVRVARHTAAYAARV